jgi:DNA-3-methyladenine glycosylase
VLPRRFYERSAPAVARDLLGCVIISQLGGALTAGRIVETEAYLGPEDGASHAAFRPGSRWLFYGPGGIAYVFRAYGLHDCLNAIAGAAGTPGCVLIRALEPIAGVRTMARRRGQADASPGSARTLGALTGGPARLTQALGISVRDNGRDLRLPPLSIHAPTPRGRHPIVISRRIGITRSPDLPLRFSLLGSPYVSKPAPGRSGPRSRPPTAPLRRPGRRPILPASDRSTDRARQDEPEPRRRGVARTRRVPR